MLSDIFSERDQLQIICHVQAAHELTHYGYYVIYCQPLYAVLLPLEWLPRACVLYPPRPVRL